MDASTLWWIAAGLAVGAELLTGTFYLLLFGLGLAAAAMAAQAGLSATAQWAAAAMLGGGACAVLSVVRSRRPDGPAATQNPNVNIDIGERVAVATWDASAPGARHTARIRYRGSDWSAAYIGRGTPAPGDYVIRALQGNELQLDHA